MPDLIAGLGAGEAMLAAFFVLLALGVPVAFSLGLSALLAFYLMGFGFDMMGDLLYAAVARFSLLAIPFFILAGVIMGHAGIAARLVYFIQVLVGSFRGGMAVVSTVVSLFWGAVSGSGPASVAAIGPFLIEAMDREHYDKAFATALVCVGSALAIVIPPSIALIIFGVLADTSITALFLAAILPGILMGVTVLAVAWLRAWRKGWGGQAVYDRSDIWKAFKDAFWGLMTPVIILGGIYGGVFTPTEAAIVAVVYAIFVGAAIYRTLTLATLYRALGEASSASAVVMLVVAAGGLFGWVMTVEGLIQSISGALLGLSDNEIVVLLMINVILLGIGMIMDAVTIMLISLPVLMPVVRHFDWDPTWFGVMMTVNLAIGLVTPPVGINLYVGAYIAKIRFERLCLAVLPLVAAAIVGLLIIAFVPQLSLWLPGLR